MSKNEKQRKRQKFIGLARLTASLTAVWDRGMLSGFCSTTKIVNVTLFWHTGLAEDILSLVTTYRVKS